MPQSHVGIFCNERTQSTPLYPNSCFGASHSVWMHLGSFRNRMKLDAKLCELVQLMRKLVPRSHTEIFLYERTQSTPLDPKLMYWCVSYHLAAFGTIMFPYESRCKTGRTSAKVCSMKSHWNFSQRKHQIHFTGP